MPENKSAVFLLNSQPPHLGELVSILLKMKDYEFMHICVSGIPKSVPIRNVVATWLFVLNAYKNVTVSALFMPFVELPKLPQQYEGYTVLTTDKEVFVHMSSIGVPVELVPRTLGYHGIFLRTAYRQGRALDWLLRQAPHSLQNKPSELGENKK